MSSDAKLLAYTGSARVVRWYDVGEHHRFACACGWSGAFREMSISGFDELVDGSCPSCDTMLIVRSFPTKDEIREAAAAGNREAAEELARMEGRKSLDRPRS